MSRSLLGVLGSADVLRFAARRRSRLVSPGRSSPLRSPSFAGHREHATWSRGAPPPLLREKRMAACGEDTSRRMKTTCTPGRSLLGMRTHFHQDPFHRSCSQPRRPSGSRSPVPSAASHGSRSSKTVFKPRPPRLGGIPGERGLVGGRVLPRRCRRIWVANTPNQHV